MSNTLYPVLPGLAWPVNRTPMWENDSRTSISGRDFTRARWSSPRWLYQLKYEFLRSAAAQAEFQQLVGLFNQMRGDWDTFLFDDPDDNTATAQQFGLGDGVTTQFQLLRALGGFVEPVFALNGTPQLQNGGVNLYPFSRTNGVLYSQNFANAAWALWNAGSGAAPMVSPGYADPFGSTNAQRVQFARTSTVTADDYSLINQTPITPGAFRSIWLRTAYPGVQQYLLFRDSSGGTYQELTVYDTWNRYSVPSVAAGDFQLGLRRGYGANQPLTADVVMYGAQAEGAAYTDYIPTTSAAVTVPAAYSLSSTGLVTMASAPSAASPLTWFGKYYWRCRFTKGQMQFSQFMKQLWEAGTVEFKTVKP